jgi:hypothetical protein
MIFELIGTCKGHNIFKYQKEGLIVLNSIREYRQALDGMYKVVLEIAEGDYEQIYGDVSKENGEDILNQYLYYHQDDARTENVDITHDKGRHMVLISANLVYTNNDHTAAFPRADHIRKEDEEIL